MSDYHQKRALEILKQIQYATIATATKEGKPWNSPVAFFYDKQANIYWFSDKESIHSANIRANGGVFVVMYDSTMAEGTGEGLYMEAHAYEVTGKAEIERIANLQTGSMRVEIEQVSGNAIHRFYKAEPTNIWINDDEKDENGNYIKDIRVAVSLDQLRKQLA